MDTSEGIVQKAHIVQSYGGPQGSSAGQLNMPCSLAVDIHGKVLVADWHNNKVQILTPALTYICDFISVILPPTQGGEMELHSSLSSTFGQTEIVRRRRNGRSSV